MEIELMDEKLYKKLMQQKDPSFVVHSVFQRACNLVTSEGLWTTLVSKNRWLPPNGMQLTHNRDLRDVFQQGEGISLSIQQQRVNRVRLDLSSLHKTEKESYKNLQVKLNYMKTYLEMNGKREALANTALPKTIHQSFQALEESLKENDLEKIRAAARGLIGFGRGLTPSADDYLTGRILMWKAWRIRYPVPAENDYSKVIQQASIGRTTTASEWMIRFAAEGRCSEEIVLFLHSYFSKSSGSAFGDAFREVLGIGSTSGEDLIYGMWSEGRRLLKKYEGGHSKWD